MSRQQSKSAFGQALAALIWPVWAGLAVLAMAAMAGVLATRWSLPDQRVFSGLLRPRSDATAVYLPGGVPLEAVLVAEGDQVRAGQTLASLDSTDLAARLDEVEAEIAAQQALRACLLDGTGLETAKLGAPGLGAPGSSAPGSSRSGPDSALRPARSGRDGPAALTGAGTSPMVSPGAGINPGAGTEPERDAESEAGFRHRSALAECAADRRATALRQAGLKEARRLLTVRRDLLSQRIALTMARPAPAPERPAPTPRPDTLCPVTVPLRPEPDCMPERVPLRLETPPPEALSVLPPQGSVPGAPSRLRIGPATPDRGADPETGSETGDTAPGTGPAPDTGDRPGPAVPDTQQATDRAQTVLALALAQSVLDERILDLRRRSATLASEAERARLARVHDLAEALQARRTQRAQLARHAAMPRLTAPHAGRILRVRPVRPGAVFPETAELVAIAPPATVELQAIVALPVAVALTLREGDPVAVRISSQIAPRRPLTGWIGQRIALPPDLAAPGLTGIEVMLGDLEALTAARAGLALHGQTTAAEIEIQLSPITLATALRRGAARFVQSTFLAGRLQAGTEATRPAALPPTTIPTSAPDEQP